jgi:hypothetical protein
MTASWATTHGVLIAALAPFALAGCVREYRPPTPDQPHATIKFRRVFEKSAGTALKERTTINGHVAQNEVASVDVASAPRASALLVYPLPTNLDVGGGFFHWETQMVEETYYVDVPYTTNESYSCGYGSNETCTRTVTQYRSEAHIRTVPQQVEVSDGWCSNSVRLAPKVGHLYLIDFTYRDKGICSATCLEQNEILSDGTFRSAPCPALTPAEEHALAAEE